MACSYGHGLVEVDTVSFFPFPRKPPKWRPVCASCKTPWAKGHRCDSGATLVAARRAAKLSQAAVARAMGVTPQYLGRVERKLTVTLSTKTAYLAAVQTLTGGDQR